MKKVMLVRVEWYFWFSIKMALLSYWIESFTLHSTSFVLLDPSLLDFQCSMLAV